MLDICYCKTVRVKDLQVFQVGLEGRLFQGHQRAQHDSD